MSRVCRLGLWLSIVAWLAGSAFTAAADGGDEEILSDPELAGTESVAPPADAPIDTGPSAATSEVHLLLHTRANRDLRADDPREEVWESTTLFALDAMLRRSESLRFGIGLMGRYHYAALEHALADTSAGRYEFDAMPTAGYLDASLGSAGLHARIGYQPLPLGRFDVFSATNVLSVADLRDGPAKIPGSPEVGQMAAKIDYSPGGWLSLQAIYLPFFMPHLVSVVDSDYALFPGRQRNSDAAFAAFDAIVPSAELQARLRSQFGRTARDRIASGALSAFTPEPSFTHPQAALRATAHGTAGELALMASTALEHLPTFRLSDAAIAAATGGAVNSNQPDAAPISIEYPRFAVFSVDGAIDVAPVSIGFEAAYQLHRTMYAVGNAAANDPLSIPVPGTTDFLHGGTRIEYAQSRVWLFVLEAFASYALSVPGDPARRWAFLDSGRFFLGAGSVLGYSTDFGLHVQLGGAWLSGPTYVLSPRVSYDIVDEVSVEAGAFIVEGDAPPMLATPSLSLGGIYNTTDHVFVGLRCAL